MSLASRPFIQQVYPDSVRELQQKKFQLGIRGKKVMLNIKGEQNGPATQRGCGVSSLGDV